MTSDDPPIDELLERLEEIEADQRDLRALFEQYIQDHLESEIDDRLNTLEQQVSHLTSQIETMQAVRDDGETDPQQRAVNLAMSLIKRAERRTETDAAGYETWQGEVKDILADHGHGPNIYNQWAQDAMEDVAEADGFFLSTMTNPDGREVKSVGVDLDKLPATDLQTVSNDIITGMNQAVADGGTEIENRPM